jgi:hypothetical protein
MFWATFKELTEYILYFYTKSLFRESGKLHIFKIPIN